MKQIIILMLIMIPQVLMMVLPPPEEVTPEMIKSLPPGSLTVDTIKDIPEGYVERLSPEAKDALPDEIKQKIVETKMNSNNTEVKTSDIEIKTNNNNLEKKIITKKINEIFNDKINNNSLVNDDNIEKNGSPKIQIVSIILIIGCMIGLIVGN